MGYGIIEVFKYTVKVLKVQHCSNIYISFESKVRIITGLPEKIYVFWEYKMFELLNNKIVTWGKEWIVKFAGIIGF